MQLARNLPMDESDQSTFAEFHWSVCRHCGATGDVTTSPATDAQWSKEHTANNPDHYRYHTWTVERAASQVWTTPKPFPPSPPRV